MIDPLSLVVGAALVLAGWVTGRHARLKAARRTEPPKPICLCEHQYGSHDDGGSCGAIHVVGTYSSKHGSKEEIRACACKRYVGPDPTVCGLWVGPSIGGKDG